jgi:hypothetical protein
LPHSQIAAAEPLERALLVLPGRRRRLSMKSLRLVAVLGLMWGVALAVPASTSAAEGRQGSRGYSNSRYYGNGGGGHGYGHSYGRSYGHGGYGHGRYYYGHAPRYAYGYRAPYYGYSYAYDPYYYYGPYGYAAPPAYYARPYYGPRVGVSVGGPHFGLYLGF